MAIYTIVTQYPDTETIGGSLTRDVQAIGAVTNEHGVYFETRLPKDLATTANIRQQVNGYAIIYEMLFDIPGVQDVQWTQVARPSGIMEDRVIVYVTSTSGQSESEMSFSYAHFNQDYIAPRVAARRQSLDNTEGG